MFYIDLPLVILAKMKHHFRRHSAVRKGVVQTLGRQELDSNVLKSALLHRHVLHVPKLVLAHGFVVEPKRAYASNGAVAQELQRYHVRVELDGVSPSGDEEHEISQTATSHLEVEPRSIGWVSFTVNSAFVFWS